MTPEPASEIQSDAGVLKPAGSIRSRKWRLALLFGAKLTVAAVLLGLVARHIHLGEALSELAQIRPFLWIVGIALNAMVLVIGAFRWHLAAMRLIPLRTCLAYSWVGHFYAMVLPGALAGDLAKTAALAASKAQHRTVILPVSVALDRVLGLISLLLILALALVVMSYQQHLLNPVLSLGVLLCAIAACVFAPRLIHAVLSAGRRLSFLPERMLTMLERIGEVVLQAGGARWLLLLLLSLLMHGLAGAVFAIAARDLGMAAELWKLGLFYVVTSVVMMLPVTIAGVGAREQISLWIFGGAAAAGVLPVTLSWFLLAASAAHAVLGGIIQLHAWWRDARRVTPGGIP